ncbi:hypothetical protein [Streptomyces sp. NPDC005407]|uniref:hypothetical protein n=1 Tax=Streptomyces sp. NPDC005407 TaxID=3155340 RepID=UPI0033A9A77A
MSDTTDAQAALLDALGVDLAELHPNDADFLRRDVLVLSKDKLDRLTRLIEGVK